MNENNPTVIQDSSKKFDQIDALRFFAVFAVLVSHWGLFPLPPSSNFLLGSNGVNLFFAISGFLITLGLIKTKQKGQKTSTSLWNFYMRRFLRIFPIYYLVLLIVWFVHRELLAGSIGWYVTYLANFHCIQIKDWGHGVVAHLWSLSIEEQFYSIWPILVLLTPVRLLPYLFGLAISASIAFKTYVIQTGCPWWLFYMHPLGALDILCLGAVLAYAYHFHAAKLEAILRNNVILAVVLFQAILVIALKFTQHYVYLHDIFMRSSFGLLSIWIIGRAVFGFTGIAGYILNSRAFRYIGRISYGVYLYHVFAAELFGWPKLPFNNAIMCFLYFIVTIAISSFSWHFIESNFLKLKGKFS